MSRRVDGSLGALLQGVSQQPVRQRLEGQVTAQTNMTSDVVRMLHRRPPTQFLNKFELGAVDIDKTFVHHMELSGGQEYYLIIPPNVTVATDIKMLDADTGIENTDLTVTAQFLTYVTGTNPKLDLKMITVGDTTFVVNNNQIVSLQTDLSDPFVLADAFLLDSGRVDIDVGQYSRDYVVTIVVSGTAYSVTHTTPVSTAGGAEAAIATDAIATAIFDLMILEAGFNDNFNIQEKKGSILLWPKVADLDYSLSSHDGIGGGAMKVSSKNLVADFAKLPTRSAHDTIYKIEGAAGSVDDLYMRFVASEPTTDVPDRYFQNGTWIETLKPDSEFIIDPNTMPHLVAFTGIGTEFELTAAGELDSDSWANKVVGDIETDKTPKFVGRTITDIMTFQDRLVFMAGEFVHMSVTADFFNFWKKTVNTLLADGPIGLSGLSNRVNNIQYAAQHNNDLIIFADERQFKIPGTPAITPQTATMTETTSFKIQSEVRPAPAGQNLFFAIDSGTYSGIREFYTDSVVDSNNATAVTVAVERYIKGKIRILSSSTNLDKLAVLAEDKRTLYLYEYLWDQNEKIQEAWSTWTFDAELEIVHMQFRADNLDLLVYIGTELHLLTLSISTDTELVVGADVHLDRRVLVQVANTTATVTTLPTDITLLDALQGDGCPNPGLRAEIKSYDGTTVTFKRDMAGGDVFIGVKYSSGVKPTMPRVRDAAGLVIGTSTLTVGEMFINFEDTGDFDVDIVGEYSWTARNPGRVLGEVSSTIGEYNLTRGSFPIPVRHAADRAEIEIRTDSPYPMTIVDIEWEGQFYKRGTRITRQG